ncbi:hypothetical protein CBFG_01040 [Clostridiales bacterium 1_7_47FAA]|nr:hypothetical protein CBFG_01040 [Clostridiales bacterium 1_7_47FAA]
MHRECSLCFFVSAVLGKSSAASGVFLYLVGLPSKDVLPMHHHVGMNFQIRPKMVPEPIWFKIRRKRR